MDSVGVIIPDKYRKIKISGVKSDSREIMRGDLFVGLPGTKYDGGMFFKEAFSAGAEAVLISKVIQNSIKYKENKPIIFISENIEKVLGDAASKFWGEPSSKLKLIGVTGTNGKTTLAHLIEHITISLGYPTALFGTLYNRWPGYKIESTHTTVFADKLQFYLSKAVNAGAQFAVMEVSSHALAQNRVSGCKFSGVIFTNLSQDHLDYHISMKNYFEAKRLLFEKPLFEFSKTKPVVNIDNEWGQDLAKYLDNRCWKCSLEDRSSDFYIVDYRETKQTVNCLIRTPFGEGNLVSPLIGKYNLMNALQAVGSLIQYEIPLEKILSGLKSFKGVPGRLERIILPRSTEKTEHKLPIVLVDYAHTPDGLKNALIACRTLANKKLICVFGCGGDRDRLKRPQMGLIASTLSDYIVLTSDNPRTEDPSEIISEIIKGIKYKNNLIIKPNRAEAIASAINESSSNDVVLIAGKGHENYQIIGDKRIHFDDREIARECLLKYLEN
tara:strand:- start:4582 stop:6075 length:1494 start_codon:yes stop_codon:yes gene_type:complete